MALDLCHNLAAAKGEPSLLLHGFPPMHVMWCGVALLIGGRGRDDLHTFDSQAMAE